MCGNVLLIKTLVFNIFRATVQKQRTILNVRQHHRGDAIVIFNNVALCKSVLGKNDLVQISFFQSWPPLKITPALRRGVFGTQ
jgi:hypothetical protein